jgi:lipopolysaccharide export system protein LptA
MNSLFYRWTLVLACVVLAGPAIAEKADRDKPMRIEADSLRYDDLKQISVFTGRVVVIKGTMTIRGAHLEVRQDPAGNQFGIMKAEPGKRAFFRQKRDTRPGTPDEFMEGEAEVIDYDGKADVVKFTQRAELRRYLGSALNDEISGVVIHYDNTTSVMTVDGGTTRAAADASPPRVRAVLTPRANEPRAAAPTPTAPPAVLRRSTTLGGDKK